MDGRKSSSERRRGALSEPGAVATGPARDIYNSNQNKTASSRISASLRLCVFILILTCATLAQSVEKVEPPNWWTGMTVDPVRVMLRGKELKGARVTVPAASGLAVSNYRYSENGHYLFFDLKIARTAKTGVQKMTVVGANGRANFDFEINTRPNPTGKYKGYSTDDVIYLIMPDRFADGDMSNNDPAVSKGLFDRSKTRRYHGGDLEGIISKLPYLKSLGVTAIWTTPIYDNNNKLDEKEIYDGEKTTGYHGYGAVDMYNTDEHFGDIAKLKELTDKARAMGIKMIQDQVANHTGPYHVWAEDPPTPTWWNGTAKDHLSNNWQKWTAMNPRATYQTQKRNLEGWFVDILPDFNQDDIEVERYLIQNSIWWVETVGYDAIRMDTLPHVPRSFWSKWGSAIKRQYPKVNILGELYDGDPALLAYFQTGRKGHDGIDTEIDTLFDFTVFYAIRDAFAQGKSIRAVSQAFARDWLYPRPEVLTTFLGVHDMLRFMNEQGATTDGLKLAQTLVMTSRGTPLLYYGDEIAMPGGPDPDNRRDFPGGFPADGIDKFAASGRSATERDVWDHLAKLGRLRQELEPLRRGKSLDLHDEEQQMAYARVTDKQAVIVAFNNDTKPAKLSFDVGMIKQIPRSSSLVDKLGIIGDVRVADDGRVEFTIPARKSVVLTSR